MNGMVASISALVSAWVYGRGVRMVSPGFLVVVLPGYRGAMLPLWSLATRHPKKPSRLDRNRISTMMSVAKIRLGTGPLVLAVGWLRRGQVSRIGRLTVGAWSWPPSAPWQRSGCRTGIHAQQRR